MKNMKELIKANQEYEIMAQLMHAFIADDNVTLFKESYNTYVGFKLKLQSVGGFNMIDKVINDYANLNLFNDWGGSKNGRL